ncbi:MAG: hypothetical protein ACLFSQ_11085 [Candidatus Zixiibacteriota bacterium]
MATSLKIPEAMRGDIKLIRHIGDVWMKTNLNVKDSSSSHSLREVEIYMGCLKNNWRLINSIGTEALPYSCTSGDFTLPVDKNYRVIVETRNLPPVLLAALMGMKMTDYFDGTTEKVLVQETVTLSASVTGEEVTSSKIDLDEIVSDSDDLLKVLSLRRKKDRSFWQEADSADDSEREFRIGLESGVAPDIVFETGTESEIADGEEFIVKLQYYRTMEEGEVKLSEDGVTFPELADFVLYWLVKAESGASRGRKGCLIASLKNCQRKGDIEIGGEAQGITSSEIAFDVNFEEEGDVEMHFSWIS